MHEVVGAAIEGARRRRTVSDLILIGRQRPAVAAYGALRRSASRISSPWASRRKELLFTRDHAQPIALAANDPALLLVQRIRDEAHRFAVTFHRRARTMRDLRSDLDGVPGVGARRRRALLTRFGSLAGVRRATREELAAEVGAKVADAVLAFFAGRT